MSKQQEDTQRAWVAARVQEFGNVQRSTPEGFTQRAWAELCRHYGISSRPEKARTLEEALLRVADLAKP